jgi:methionyl aminopeptidase
LEKLFEKNYKEAREAAEVHRQVRKFIQNFVKPGMKMIDICEAIEDKVRTLIQADGRYWVIVFLSS